jgi:ABC-2 type transport system permease protein
MAAFWMIAMPVIFAYVFGMVFRPSQRNDVWMPVADYDGGRMAQLLVEQLRGPGFNVNVLDPGQRESFEERPRTLVIPKGFTEQVLAGQQGKLYFVFRTKETASPYDLSAKVRLIEALGRILPGMVRVQLVDRFSNGVEAWDELEEELAKDMPVTVEVRSASNVPVPPRGFGQTSVGYLVLFVLINTVVFGGATLVSERTGGQLRRLATSPVTRSEILLGMMLGRGSLAMVQIILLIVATSVLFHVNWGQNPLALALVVLSFSFACASLGLLLGCWVSGVDQAVLLGVVGGNVMGGLGGCWWPIEIMPERFRAIAYVFPTGWATHGLHEVVSWGRGTAAIIPETLVLLLFGLVFLLLTVRILRYE